MPASHLSVDRRTFAEWADEAPVVVYVTAELPYGDPLGGYAAVTGRREGRGQTDDDRDADGRSLAYSFLFERADKVASSDPTGALTTGTTAESPVRYSAVGYEPPIVISARPGDDRVSVLDDRYRGLIDIGGGDVVDRLRSAFPDVASRGFPRRSGRHFAGGLVGFLSYDAVYDLFLHQVGVNRPRSKFPDAEFVLSTKNLVYDHVAERTKLVFTPVVSQDDDPQAVYDALLAEARRIREIIDRPNRIDGSGFRQVGQNADRGEDFRATVRRTKEYVREGDIYQGVISRRRQLYGDIDTLQLYATLRELNPSPYMYLCGFDDTTLVGASPETLVEVRDRKIVTNPIAGTCKRGDGPVDDRRQAGRMLVDGKERAEHAMLVDLARNDVRRVSEAGSVGVEEFMNVIKYSNVQHIESTVVGRLAAGADAFDATRATFPAGTLSGAPKLRAMEIIDELEKTPRGPYGGGIGYYSWTGEADLAIIIRTATVTHDVAVPNVVTDGSVSDEVDRVTIRAGAGIVADSDLSAEFEETQQKMDSVCTALERIRKDRAGEIVE
ncbi:anthranilate synthase component I [Halobacteriales archaeon QS_1_69_70]|nr:MAG: anthranilate synthase component I [Halobacteriales archaeon QS_1_69_70]